MKEGDGNLFFEGFGQCKVYKQAIHMKLQGITVSELARLLWVSLCIVAYVCNVQQSITSLTTQKCCELYSQLRSKSTDSEPEIMAAINHKKSSKLMCVINILLHSQLVWSDIMLDILY